MGSQEFYRQLLKQQEAALTLNRDSFVQMMQAFQQGMAALTSKQQQTVANLEASVQRRRLTAPSTR